MGSNDDDEYICERIMNSPQSAEQVSLQMLNERRGGANFRSQGGW